MIGRKLPQKYKYFNELQEMNKKQIFFVLKEQILVKKAFWVFVL